MKKGWGQATGQYSDTDGWVAARTDGRKNPIPLIPTLFRNVGGDAGRGGTG